MNVYGVYGEDIDFTAGATVPVADTSSGRFRDSWARCSVRSLGPGSFVKSNPFIGALTSCWLSFQIFTSAASASNQPLIGLILSSTPSSGLWIGVGTTAGKIAIQKYDGTTLTQLAQSSANVFILTTLNRVDVQLTNYGASASVNVYVNGTSVVSFTGDVRVSGVSNVDCVALGDVDVNPSTFGFSEILVADSDTRAVQGIQTLALTGAGTTNNWTNNTFTNINGTSFSDTNPTSVNTTGTDQQYNVTDPTPTNFSVIAVKQSARMAKSATPTPTRVKLGYNSGGTVAFGTGATKSLTTSYATYEQIDATNPATGNAFTSSELTALQLDMQSA